MKKWLCSVVAVACAAAWCAGCTEAPSSKPTTGPSLKDTRATNGPGAVDEEKGDKKQTPSAIKDHAEQVGEKTPGTTEAKDDASGKADESAPKEQKEEQAEDKSGEK
jgi:hypothetical protein